MSAEFDRGVTRRDFLKAITAAGGLAVLPVGCGSQARAGNELIASAAGAKPEQFGLSWVTSKKQRFAKQAVAAHTGFRGHDVVQHPLRLQNLLLIARRPGTEVIEVNTHTGEVVNQFACTAGQHLNGHACFSADGNAVFTTESNIAKGEGNIVVRDAHDYRILGQFPSNGIEPHEAKLLPDGKTLAVANGGILTHPLSGRKKLNLESMQSSLTYLDINNGKLIDQFILPESKASIRHLDIADDGAVVFATQLQREVVTHNDIVALGGRHLPGQALEMFEQPQAVIARLNDYMGSVRVNNSSRLVGFTSPRGNLAVFWDLDSGAFKNYHSFHDVCGIACTTDDQQFVLSNSLGQLRKLDAFSLQEQRHARATFPGSAWDNHLLIVNSSA